MESFMGDLSACETMIMKVIWDAKEDIALQDLIRELADRYKKNYARTTVVTFVHKIVDKGFATTYRKGKAAYIHPEKSLAAYRDELLQQQLEFWFDGKPSAFLSAWCEKNKLSREEADRTMYNINCCGMIAVKREVAAYVAGFPWSECQVRKLTTSHCTNNMVYQR